MRTCLICRQPPTKRDGYDRHGRHRYTCRRCRRDFTQLSGSAFSGYRWPAEVILACPVTCAQSDRCGDDFDHLWRLTVGQWVCWQGIDG
jgi:transposase-like protein